MKLTENGATIYTENFKFDYEMGDVTKVGTASFFDGNRRYERTLYFDKADQKNYVLLNGQAYQFKVYPNCSEPGLIIGRI